MTTSRKIVRVFISSTFRDMQAEQDQLIDVVFPALAKLLRTRRCQLEPIDLRVGVETADTRTEHERELQILKVCLAGIERRHCLLPMRARLFFAVSFFFLMRLAHPCTMLAAFDWQAGPWGIVVASNGSPGSVSCPIDYPAGTKTGNALAVHYQFSPTNLPQLWVLLTDGFWRQASPESEFLTSYRLFRYYSSGDEDCDRLAAARFSVLGTNELGELQIDTVYSNNAPSGDRFLVAARIVLEKPDALQSAMRTQIVVSNASARAVIPSGPLHGALAEQWELFGISSMYVADNLTGGLPAWYNDLDPSHRYVGLTNDASYLNDGYSVNGMTNVSTHDVKFIVASNATVALNHLTNLCPIVVVPGYEWYDQLILRGLVASSLRVQHAYRSARNHQIQIFGCAGLLSEVAGLKWAATYNRNDANMVDGDNLQVKLGLDDFLADGWPGDGVQVLNLRLSTGNFRPTITSLSVMPPNNVTLGWTTEPGERYALQHLPVLGGDWTNAAVNLPGPFVGPLAIPPGLLRIVETPVPGGD